MRDMKKPTHYFEKLINEGKRQEFILLFLCDLYFKVTK